MGVRGGETKAGLAKIAMMMVTEGNFPRKMRPHDAGHQTQRQEDGPRRRRRVMETDGEADLFGTVELVAVRKRFAAGLQCGTVFFEGKTIWRRPHEGKGRWGQG